MIVIDSSRLMQRLWEQPGENADYIIAMTPESTVYAHSSNGADGFAVIWGSPDSKWFWLADCSLDQAEALLVEAGVGECRWVAAPDAATAGMIERRFGFRQVRESLTYVAEKGSFRPCEAGERVCAVTPESASRVLEFANTEADDHPSWESAEAGGDWSMVAYYAEDDSGIVGYADSVAHPGPLREIGYVFVKPDARGKGYGRMLVSAITSQLLDGGQVPLYMVDASNAASVRTCESLGYRLCRRLHILEAQRSPV